MEEESICIIGAGVSGLVACKHAVAKGFRPVVFESRSSIGGVWTKTLQSTKLQTTRSSYQFSDFPWPHSVVEDFPDSKTVLDYIQTYAAHFDLVRHIRLSTRVLSLTYDGPSDDEMQSWTLWGGSGDAFSRRGTWIVTVEDSQTQSSETLRFKFVILCVGRFSDEPNIPEFPSGKGPEAFRGRVIHSVNYSDMENAIAAEFIKGKRVAVVGFQKSALDIAMECSSSNGVDHPCTVLYRTKHWNVPDFLPWGFPLESGPRAGPVWNISSYISRFSELLLHKPNEGFLLSLLATFLSPLRWLFSKFVESGVRKKLRLSKFGMVPEHSFLQEISSCMTATVPEGFYDRVEKGSIRLKNSPSFCFCKDGVLINNGSEKEEVEADVVILCTGFQGIQKLKHIFSSKTIRNHIAATVPLYRECIHPQIPQLAVIGFSESLSNVYTSEMMSRWVAELVQGSFKLPSIKEMEKDVQAWDVFMKRYSDKYDRRRSCIGSVHIWYNDQLCKDMGLNPHRKKGFLADLFQPYGPLDYAVDQSSSIIFFYEPWDPYGDFSNFSPHSIQMPDENGDCITWSTVEHYYQAQKFVGVSDPRAQVHINEIKSAKTPDEAFAIARKVQRECPNLVRDDWEQVKIDKMYNALKCKFSIHPQLNSMLLNTKGSVLVENSPHDLFWGRGSDGKGLNYMGKLLMQLRSEFRGEFPVSVAQHERERKEAEDKLL